MLMMVAQFSFGQTISDFVNSFKTNPACQYMPISKEMMPMVASQAPENVRPLFEKMEGMEMLMINANDDLKAQIKASLSKLNDNGYEKKQIAEGQESMVSYIKIEDNVVKQMLTVVEQGNTCICMVMKGSFAVDDLKKMASAGQ